MSSSDSGVRSMAKASSPPAPPSFEVALTELETVVASMEGGQLTLADSLAAYKRGAELLKYCRGVLEDAQQQIKVLEGDTLKDLTGADGGA